MSKIMPQNELIHVYGFTVCVGSYKLNFSKITGIKSAVKFETIQEGGLNDRVHYFYAPNSEPDRLIMERGLYKPKSGEFILKPGMRFSKDMTIFLVNNKSEVLRKFAVEAPVLEEWSVSDLDALSGEIAVYKATIIHRGITELSEVKNDYMKKFDFT